VVSSIGDRSDFIKMTHFIRSFALRDRYGVAPFSFLVSWFDHHGHMTKLITHAEDCTII